jgi:hypothetical protein
MKQCFRLYTWQLPHWDVTREKRDHSKGSQGWGEDTWKQLRPLYTKLKEKVGTLDFLWCFPAYEHWNKYEIRRLWVLDVPSSKIFRFIDSNVWEAMIQNALNNQQPAVRCWDRLIVERNVGMKRLSREDNGNITPLVHVPLSPSILVVDNSKFNKGTADPYAPYKDLPTSECEAMKCREEEYRKKSRKTMISRPSKLKKEEIGEN